MFATLLAVPAALIPLSDTEARGPESSFSYDYFQVGYISTDFEAVGEATDGVRVKASYGINEYVNFVGSYSYERLDVTGADTDFSTLTFGAGVHAPLHEKLDVYGEASIVSAEVEVMGASARDTGYGLEAGFRLMPIERIELNAAVVHVDLDDNSTNLAVGSRGYLTDYASLGFFALFDSDADTYGVNLRFEF